MADLRPLETTSIANVTSLRNLQVAAQNIQTSEKVLRRVAYWDRAYMLTHRCRCGVTWVKDEFGWYRDSTLCHCFSAYTEYRKQWIALRCLVPSHQVERIVNEVEVLYDLAERETGAEPELDYLPSAAETARIRRCVEPHQQAIQEAILVARAV
jgi:hypothetical protein